MVEREAISFRYKYLPSSFYRFGKRRSVPAPYVDRLAAGTPARTVSVSWVRLKSTSPPGNSYHR
nr:hypothetical protein Q903MT_gene4729 [Picea sitchensis]